MWHQYLLLCAVFFAYMATKLCDGANNDRCCKDNDGHVYCSRFIMDDGRMIESIMTRDGVRHGQQATYFYTGARKAVWDCKNGKKDGVYTAYDNNGYDTIHEVFIYQNGRMVWNVPVHNQAVEKEISCMRLSEAYRNARLEFYNSLAIVPTKGINPASDRIIVIPD